MTKKNENAAAPAATENTTAATTENTTAATTENITAEPVAEDSSDKGFIVLLLAEDGTFSARIFDTKKEIAEAVDLENLPTGIRFFKVKEIHPKVKTVVKVSL